MTAIQFLLDIWAAFPDKQKGPLSLSQATPFNPRQNRIQVPRRGPCSCP